MEQRQRSLQGGMSDGEQEMMAPLAGGRHAGYGAVATQAGQPHSRPTDTGRRREGGWGTDQGGSAKQFTLSGEALLQRLYWYYQEKGYVSILLTYAVHLA